MNTLTRFAIISALLISAGCTTEKTPIPELTGPSELALALRLQLSPDSILGDGGSQSVLTIEATGPDGRPVRGLPLQVEISADGFIFDFGTLSAKTVITGDDGRARVIYTSPRVNQTSLVTFIVTPIGGDFRGQIGRTIDLRLVPTGVIGPPNLAPIPRFTFTPANPSAFQTVTFDASDTRDPDPRNPASQPICGANCTYQWDFGDGSTATGVFTSHQFTEVRSYQVRLTVTDAQGLSAQTAVTITVGPGAPPSGSFTFSPDAPGVGQPVFFNASAVTAAPGRRIVSYSWNFGDGTTGSGVTVTHSYNAPGVYRVTLTVEDDAGTRLTLGPEEIEVGTVPGLAAVLSVTPNPGTTNDTFFFDASSSSGTSRIVSYRFIFGDGTPDDTRPTPTTNHRYLTPGTYVAEVVVTDVSGRTARQTRVVTVNAP